MIESLAVVVLVKNLSHTHIWEFGKVKQFVSISNNRKRRKNHIHNKNRKKKIVLSSPLQVTCSLQFLSRPLSKALAFLVVR